MTAIFFFAIHHYMTGNGLPVPDATPSSIKKKPDTLNRTLTHSTTALILFVLANIFPFITFKLKGLEQTTILTSGGYQLCSCCETKPVVLIYLLISIQLKFHWYPKERTVLYRIKEGSIRGLTEGAPVEFRGIKVGSITFSAVGRMPNRTRKL